ncbi:MAG: RNA polymerase subunit sigma [Candidatus Marinimicrobia bacterium]|nr:RNA polymerase subunit sigma [Candidatus Neomarinimicrobiota bacterium]
MVIDSIKYSKIVFFTGAGMSAESGVPTYRGSGGIWDSYKWQDYACQSAFDANPEHVLDFHELRRIEAKKCKPHVGHQIITEIQNNNKSSWIVTQNIDGMHQRAQSKNVIELHGSLWELRCEAEMKIFMDIKNPEYAERSCKCGLILRPNIIWFEDNLNQKILNKTYEIVSQCDLFISIGTSGSVFPAAGIPKLAKSNGALCIEINPENTPMSSNYDMKIRKSASEGLIDLRKEL